MVFFDRRDAGRRLGERLLEFVQPEAVTQANVLVLALPRGGVPVAAEVARTLKVALDVFVARKLGVPGHEELAMGAIASGGVCLVNAEIVVALRITPAQIEETVTRETQELERREELYRGARAALDVRDRSIILVDDGLATGYTMRAAIAALRQRSPHAIIAAVPVAARSTCEQINMEADAAICLYMPFEFVAVGQWYRNFAQTSDEEVRHLLEEAAGRNDQQGA